MNLREKEEDNDTKVHDIKFDEYGIMDDGVDESTNEQLAKLKTVTGEANSRCDCSNQSNAKKSRN